MKFIPKEKILIAFHIYQFNITEIKIAQEYFKHLGIRVFSSFAYFNDFYMAQKYLANSFNTIEMQKISKELLLFYVDDLLLEMPDNYSCPQLDILTIDEKCNIIRCCGVPRDSEDYKISDINSVNKQQLLVKDKANICIGCYKTKLVYWGHNTGKVSTDFIHKILK